MKTLPLQRAKVQHAQGIYELLTAYSDQALLLPRTVNEILPIIQQFIIVEDTQTIVGCVALEVFTHELGEVRSLAVNSNYKGQHLGQRLLQETEDWARELGLQKLMALTYVEEFFHKYGYETVEMSSLPEKVWRVCVKCPKFHNCDEIPVVKHL